MALTGLQIQKLLPQTNCKECGSNTCLAFAMKLASRKADITQCPYASEEAVSTLGEAYEPPVRAVPLGKDGDLIVGEETVLYRHEKTFVHKPLLAVTIEDTDPDTDGIIRSISGFRFERVGEIHHLDMIAVVNRSGNTAHFVRFCTMVYEKTAKPLIIASNDADALIRAAEAVSGSGSVLRITDGSFLDTVVSAAAAHGHAVSITAPDLDSLYALSGKLKEHNFTRFLLEFTVESLSERFQTSSISRRAAVRDNVKALGYPFLRFVDKGELTDETVDAATEILKYGGICVLPRFDMSQLTVLMTLRLNIYTDPQKPIQVEPGLYPIGEPDEKSPVFVTTNFSLTYFVVTGEIENSGISAWLLVPECDGMSVLTAWAAGKFSAPVIARSAADADLEHSVKNRTIIIPGYVAQISGELEEAFPGWKIIVGPQEASDIEGFVKTLKLR